MNQKSKERRRMAIAEMAQANQIAEIVVRCDRSSMQSVVAALEAVHAH